MANAAAINSTAGLERSQVGIGHVNTRFGTDDPEASVSRLRTSAVTNP